MAHKVQVLIKKGSYRNEAVINKVFTLVHDYREGSKGGYLTVEGGQYYPERGDIRVLVGKKDYVLNGTANGAALMSGDEDDNHITHAFLAAVPKPETDAEMLTRITERFEILDDMTQAVANSDVTSLIVQGAPGTGKSFGVEKVLADTFGAFDTLSDQKPSFQVVKGGLSAVGLFVKLYQYREKGKVLVFDDCDNIFYDDLTLNLLKAALDSGKKKRIFWQSDSNLLKSEGIPNDFQFDGGVIFITNIDFNDIRGKRLKDHLAALQSRCHFLDLTIQTSREKMLRINDVVKRCKMLESYELEPKIEKDILEFVAKHAEDFRELSLRTVLKIADIARSFPTKWEKMARVTVVGM